MPSTVAIGVLLASVSLAVWASPSEFTSAMRQAPLREIQVEKTICLRDYGASIEIGDDL